MKGRIVSKPGAAITVTRLEMTPEEQEKLTAPRDAWDAMLGTESMWQIVKRKVRGLLTVLGINWRRIPMIRGEFRE